MEKDWLKINALVPFLEAGTGGNFTRIIMAGGEEITEQHRVSTVVKAVCSYYQVDQKAAQKASSNYLGKKKWVPLPVHKDLVLVPLRFRQSPFRDAGATGYINLLHVSGCKAASAPYLSEVRFNDGTSISCFNTVRYVKSMLRQGEQVRERYLMLHHGSVSFMENLIPVELLEVSKSWIILVPRQ